MTVHADNKRLLARFLTELADTPEGAIGRVLASYCEPDCQWEIFHPFNSIHGNVAAAERFWAPLKRAFPDYEQRLAFVIGGEYEGRDQVSSLGQAMGSFAAPWLGIPPTHGLTFLRFGVNAIVRAGRIAKAYILLDVIDVMRQSGFYPLRRMPGSAEAWPFPPVGSGAAIDGCDATLGAKTLAIVREMQVGLPVPGQLTGAAAARAAHSPHWHEHMNWYGPAGIGSSRSLRGFRDYHGALFIQAFPDRNGILRDHDGPEDAHGHYTRLGDGRFAVTGGWPSLYGTHLGGQWLGLPPTGRKVAMRVADWYRTDADDKLIDNWVMIDIPHILDQLGLDILDDLRFFADPSEPRLR